MVLFRDQLVNSIKKKYLIGITFSFLFTFFFQLFFNRFSIICRSLPDEMGAMYLASVLAGNDWDYVMTHPAYYYGSFSTPLLYPFFVLIKDPLLLYQCLLGVGAFLRSVPSIICFIILIKYWKIQDIRLAVLISTASCFLTPTRSNNIDNEPGLILCCWIIVFLIISLEQDSLKRNRIYKSVFLAIVLNLSLLGHTRAILYSIATIIVIFLYHILTRHSLVNYKWFAITYLIMFALSQRIIAFLTTFLYTGNASEMDIANTSGSLGEQLNSGLDNVFSHYGFQSFLDLICSNLVIVFVFSSGIIVYAIWFFIIRTYYIGKGSLCKKIKIKRDAVYFPLAFCILGGCISAIGLGITWIGGAVEQHINATNLTRGYFYLRYYSNFFSPVLMLLSRYYIVDNSRMVKKSIKSKIITFSLCTIIFCSIYCWGSFLSDITYKYSQENSDWFYYFAPFTLRFQLWPDAIQDTFYYVIPIIVSVVFFSIIIFLVKKKLIRLSILFIICSLLYQYTYLVIFWDKPYSDSQNYYGSVNAIYDFKKEYPEIFDKIDKIYYKNKIYGPQYLVQFVMQDIPVVLDEPAGDNVILLSSTVIENDEEITDNYMYLPLDENEILYVKGEHFQQLFMSYGLELNVYKN